MSRNGSGTYSLPAGNPVSSGTTINSTTHNNTMSDIATALTQSLASDGQTTPTANLPMGGYKHTSVAVASVRTDYARASDVQDGTLTYLTGVAGTDTITANAPLAMSAYAAGQVFYFVSTGANTGAATLNINSIGAKSITKNGTTALGAGDIPSGAIVTVVYDGTRFQLASFFNIAPGTSGNVLTSNGTAWTSATPTTGKVRQVVSSAVTPASNTTTIPSDDTPPTNTEGTQVWSLAITPTSSSNSVKVNGVINVGGTTSMYVGVALFRGSTLLWACEKNIINAVEISPIPINVLDAPATTSATTYSIRVGAVDGAGTWTVSDSLTARFGAGAQGSTIELMEIAP